MRIRWAVIFFLSLLLVHRASASVPVVISTDIGNEIDDQWVVAYLLANPAFEVKGLLSAYSPSMPSPAGRHSAELLRTIVERRMGMPVHPPIASGGDEPLNKAQGLVTSDAVELLIAQSRGYTRAHPLTVVVIGAATDVAIALLTDATLEDRIRIVAMGFQSDRSGKEYNVENDPEAWRTILASTVDVTIGDQAICQRDLAPDYTKVLAITAASGPLGAWLWHEYETWYYQHGKPLRTNDFSKKKVLWDLVTVAYLDGLAETQDKSRPKLADDLTLGPSDCPGKVHWVTKVDSEELWRRLENNFAQFGQTHRLPSQEEASSF